jgi:hypothetical protein
VSASLRIQNLKKTCRSQKPRTSLIGEEVGLDEQPSIVQEVEVEDEDVGMVLF